MPIPRKPIDWQIANKTWAELSLAQQNHALRLVVLHARMEYMSSDDYARCIQHWQVDPAGALVGWISNKPETQAKAPNNG